MKRFLLIGALVLVFAAVSPALAEQFKGQVGLQMYSVRSVAEDDMEAAMKLASELGFTIVEANRLYKTTAEEYKALLDKYGLKPVCKNQAWKMYETEEGVQEVIREAKLFGIRYVGVAWYPHGFWGLTESEAIAAAKRFNEIGERFSREGMIFVYHNHGYEFLPWKHGKPGETIFDLLIQKTDPRWVTFNMDVTWMIFPGADPVHYLRKYPDRFRLMHLKDLKKGVKGNLSGTTPTENDVALGTGQANFPEILKAAQEAGVEYYLIEDESDDFRTQIPESMKYLKSISW